MQAARNAAIILGLAALVSLAPGGFTGYSTVSNIVSVLFVAGLGFFAYRMYMENRITLLDLPERRRAILYGSTALIVFALIATRRYWEEPGALTLLWFAIIATAAYGFATVIRTWREY